MSFLLFKMLKYDSIVNIVLTLIKKSIYNKREKVYKIRYNNYKRSKFDIY